jgi:aspartate kinase
MKFGGALLNSASNIERVAGLVEEFSCEPLVVVISALGKTTNALEHLFSLSQKRSNMDIDFFKIKQYHLSAAQNIMPNLPNELSRRLDKLFDELWDSLNTEYPSKYEAYDSIISIGEDLSSCIFYHYLKSLGHSVRLINAKTLIVTDDNYTNASVNWEYTTKTIIARILPAIDNHEIVITQGFTGADEFGNSTTLGREGSDFTAAIIGNILDADEVTIWKNVPGLMNADPAKFPDAVKLKGLSYHEATELAYYGASVIHPKTIQPLKQKNIPLFVRAYYDSSIPPTAITNDASKDGILPSIIVKDNQILLSISTLNLSFIAEENLKNIFDAFSKNKIHINLMQNSAVSFSVCFDEDFSKLDALITELKSDFNLRYNTNLQLITVRHYNDNIVNNLIAGNKVYLFQKSRVNVQFLVKQ